MYSLTISFGPSATTWAFLFKDKEKANLARVHVVEAILHEDDFCIEDEFGQIASWAKNTIHGVCLEDLDQSEEARIQRSLAEARLRAKLEQRASSDPVIRQATRGPAVLSPVPGGFRQ
jgi:hypothetical protein